MPRISYYQEVGNPIQWELLPHRQMSLALPMKDASASVRLSRIAGILWGLVALDVIDAFLRLFRPEEPFVIVRSLSLFFVSVYIVYLWVARLRGLLVRIFVVLMGVTLSANIGLVHSGLQRSALAPLAVGLIASVYFSVFAKHWTERCLCSPLDRETAAGLRRSWQGAMLLLASVPLIAALIFVSFGTLAAGGFLLAAILLPQVATVFSGQGPWKWQAWSSWLNYGLDQRPLPGMFQSPAGGNAARVSLMVASSVVVSVWLREYMPFLPLMVFVAIAPVFVMSPLLAEADTYRRDSVTPERWPAIIREIRTSPNPIERKSFFMGRLNCDGSPLVVPRDVFFEHAHFLGDSGAGKTALGLAPLIEQTIDFGDCSLVTVNLKADTLELLATMIRGRHKLRRERGIEMPLKYLATREDFSSFAFNPQSQPFWRSINSNQRTDLLTGATGLDYGPDFGAAFYSAANSGVLNYTYEMYPTIETFEELAESLGHVLMSADRRELHAEIRKNGVHVHEVLKRLGSFAPLNVTRESGLPLDVVEHAIDLADFFRRPQMLYCHLSSTLGPGSAPALARFVVFFLLACASTAERKVPVFLVIDEFQRMVARNFEYMLQLARSMNVGIILANQSLQDLHTPSANLIPTIEANCRYRQWFSVSSLDDRRRLSESSGETIEYFTSLGQSQSKNGASTSMSISERVMPRLSTNEIAMASDHPKQSIVRISRGQGYAQYGGLPFIAESDFHITREEYEHRKQMHWPSREPGTFIPREFAAQGPPLPPPGPVVTTEIIGGKPEMLDDPFAEFLDGLKAEQKPKKKRKRGQ